MSVLGDPLPVGVFLSLPADVLRNILSVLPPVFLARIACSCQAIRAEVNVYQWLWKKHCGRWRTWEPDVYVSAEAGRTTWQALYKERVLKERKALQLLESMQDPSIRHASIRSLHGLGADVVEFLSKMCAGSEPLLQGRRYFAAQALGRVCSLRSAERMRALLARPGASTRLDEGALLLAQLHYPHADLSPVARFLDDLGAELRRRMEAEGVRGGLRALALLSELLFGRRDPALPQDEGEPPDEWTWSDAEAARLVLPRTGYSLGIKGNSRNYYDATNSLLPFVLVWRRGIPISIAQLHAAVGRRAGLPIEPVAVPMHFMNKMGEPNTLDERFIDVFRSGVLLTRGQTCALMAEMGVGVNEAMLRPVDAECVYVRACANLVNQQYRQGGPHIHSKLRPVLDLLLAARPHARDYLSMRAYVAERLEDFEAARVDLLALVGQLPEEVNEPQRLPADVQPAWRRLVEGELELFEKCCRAMRRPRDCVRFRVGQVIRHARYGYGGVITGWDATCQADPVWIAQMNVDALPSGRDQPFYHVLVDVRHRPCQATYVAEDNIQEHTLTGAEDDEGLDESGAAVLHPDVGEYFDGLPKGSSRYVPNRFMRARYPDDFTEPVAA